MAQAIALTGILIDTYEPVLIMVQLGAEATLLPTKPDINPPVLATFCGSEEYQARPRILFYGLFLRSIILETTLMSFIDTTM